jgi:hypothetical protein
MGCQCANQKEEVNDELTKNDDNIEGVEEIENNNNNNYEQKDEIFGLANQEGVDTAQLKENNNENKDEEDYNQKLNEDKNTKYADYPDKMLELINKIREEPASYAEIIEDSIKNIVENQDDDETKPKIIYKKKVKVALTRGEPAFREAAEILRNMEPLSPLEFKNDICVPLPDNEDEIKDSSYLKEQVKVLRQSANIDVYFKDLVKLPEVSALLMIVDDGEKNAGRKRNAVLNKDFKYIGINSKFVGKTFVAYFTFSK